MKPLLIVITGPTASGKSEFAISLASRLGCHIISADSRQIYRDIPIVTAAPTPEQLARVPHHLVGCCALSEPYSASRFEQQVLALLPSLFDTSPCAILCGGSMMYIDAVFNGLDPQPDIPSDIRRRVVDRFHTSGIGALQQWLQQLDPQYYARVDLSNHVRLIHAIEVSLVARRPYSSLLGTDRPERPFSVVMMAPDMPRQQLFNRINTRVDTMIADGLEHEARRVYPLRHLKSLNTVGLKEMFAYFDGTLQRSEAIARIARNTRVYAKKQLTWMRRYPSLHPLDVSGDMLGQAISLLRANGLSV